MELLILDVKSNMKPSPEITVEKDEPGAETIIFCSSFKNLTPWNRIKVPYYYSAIPHVPSLATISRPMADSSVIREPAPGSGVICFFLYSQTEL